LRAAVHDLRMRNLIRDEDRNMLLRWALEGNPSGDPSLKDVSSLSSIANRRLIHTIQAAKRNIMQLENGAFSGKYGYASIPESGCVLSPVYSEPTVANSTGKASDGGKDWNAFGQVSPSSVIPGLKETLLVQRALQHSNEWLALVEQWQRHIALNSGTIIESLSKMNLGQREIKCLHLLGITTLTRA